jgi:hypothetical protein
VTEYTNAVRLFSGGNRGAGLATSGQPSRNGAIGLNDNWNEKTPTAAAAATGNIDSRRGKPTWDSNLRELRVGKLVIKSFRKPARSLVTVLASFQELRWCRRIDDPLPGNAGYDPKRRLRDTVFALNRQHITRNVLVIEADGTGTGIIWRWYPYNE